MAVEAKVPRPTRTDVSGITRESAIFCFGGFWLGFEVCVFWKFMFREWVQGFEWAQGFGCGVV